MTSSKLGGELSTDCGGESRHACPPRELVSAYKSTKRSPCIDRERCRRCCSRWSCPLCDVEVNHKSSPPPIVGSCGAGPIMIKATMRSVGSALINSRNAGVSITGPVAHLLAICSACKLNNTFWTAAQAAAYFKFSIRKFCWGTGVWDSIGRNDRRLVNHTKYEKDKILI